MSPSSRSVCYTPVGSSVQDLSAMDGKDLVAGHGGFSFGIRKQENHRGAPLKVSKDSLRIRKPPLPLPQVQYRPPVIIHTYSPKVLHTEPDDFMSLVQKLTGSSDTRLRLKKMKPMPKKKADMGESDSAGKASNSEASPESIRHSPSAAIQRQGSGVSSATSNCGSPTSSEDSATFVVADPGPRHQGCELASVVKQSNSPRSPFDSEFEFDHNDNLSIFSHFDGPTPAATMFSSNVKTESSFSFTENYSNTLPFHSSISEFLHPPLHSKPIGIAPKLTRSQPYPQDGLGSYHIDASTGYLPTNLLAGLPDLSSGWSTQSHYLDGLSVGASTCFVNQGSYLRQRQFSGGCGPAPEATALVALENLHAFSMTRNSESVTEVTNPFGLDNFGVQ